MAVTATSPALVLMIWAQFASKRESRTSPRCRNKKTVSAVAVQMECISFVLCCEDSFRDSAGLPQQRQNKVQVDLTSANYRVIASYCCSAQDFGKLTSESTAHSPPVQQKSPLVLSDWSAAGRYLIASADQINVAL